MGFLHIDNLYKNGDEILMFKQVYALEKVHGTSAHIMFKDGEIIYYSGGAKYSTFEELFDDEALYTGFMKLGHNNIVIYGEACGGRIQKMRHLYGDDMRFIAFDVKIGDTWLNVPNAEEIVTGLGLEFVPYDKIDADLDKLNELRDSDSDIAKRWSTEGGIREGIVIRPLIEITNNRGNRVISKHKGAAFSEQSTAHKEVNPDKLALTQIADGIAEKWVNDMRLTHVMDAIDADYMEAHKEEKSWAIEDTKVVIQLMIADLRREGEGEFTMDNAVMKFVGARTARLYQAWLTSDERMDGIV